MSHETAVLDRVPEIEPPQEQSAPAPAILAGLPEARNGDMPAWFRARQQEAWSRFASLPVPTRNDQPWRFSNVAALDLAPFVFSEPVVDDDRREILERSTSLVQRSWEHERTLGEDGTVTDRVTFASRLPGAERLARPLVAAVFRHRHRRLSARFGRP